MGFNHLSWMIVFEWNTCVFVCPRLKFPYNTVLQYGIAYYFSTTLSLKQKCILVSLSTNNYYNSITKYNSYTISTWQGTHQRKAFRYRNNKKIPRQSTISKSYPNDSLVTSSGAIWIRTDKRAGILKKHRVQFSIGGVVNILTPTSSKIVGIRSGR